MAFRFFFILAFCLSVPLPTFAAPAVWVTHGSERVMLDTAVRTSNTVELYAARGEYEPFQIVVLGPASGVNVVVSDLKTASGATIPKSSMTLYRVHYVHVEKTPNLGPEQSGNPAGLYPEWLIPFNHPYTGAPLAGAMLDAVPFNVSSGKNQPVWVDIKVPTGASAGRYTGTITVSSNEGSASATVVLNVWNFTLPQKLALQGEGAKFRENTKEGAIELLRHNIAIRGLTNLSWQNELISFDRYGLKTSDASFWTGVSIGECSSRIYSPPSVADVRAKVSKYSKELVVYAYFADEPGKCLNDANFSAAVKRFAKALQDGGAVPMLTQPPQERIWIPGPYIWPLPINIFGSQYQSDINRALADPAQEVWTYHTTFHDGVSPKMFFVSSPPMHMRMQAGFMNHALGTKGVLFYWTDNWREISNSWTTLKSYFGSGQVVAHGSVVGVPGVVAGIRLKRFRDGAEDYEYVELLKKAGQGAFAKAKVAELVTSNSKWTKDMDKLLAVRRELGEKLHQLGGGVGTAIGTTGGSSGGSIAPIYGPCNVINSGDAPPQGYGASWNLFSSHKEMLISATCEGGEGSPITYTVGSAAANQYVYKRGYWYDTAWHIYNLSGTFVDGSTDWFRGQGTHKNVRPNFEQWYVGYVCHWQSAGQSWKCGCRDTACTTNYWQLQGVKR